MGEQQEKAGYYCLLIAIICDLNVSEAIRLYEYGPEHPFCQKYKKIKACKMAVKQMKNRPLREGIKELKMRGYSIEMISDVYDYHPSTVSRILKNMRS